MGGVYVFYPHDPSWWLTYPSEKSWSSSIGGSLFPIKLFPGWFFIRFNHIISSSKALVSRHREDAPDVPHRCPWSSGDTSRARELWDLLPTARMERDEGTVDLSETTLSDWSRHGGYRRFTIGKWRIYLTFHDQHGGFTIGFTLYLVQDIASLTEDMCDGQNTYYDLWPMNMDEHSPMWVQKQTIEHGTYQSHQ